MNENEFEHEGKRYRAVAEKHDCRGCAFELCLDGCCSRFRSPSCVATVRQDFRNVIFVEVKP